jgi:hypothetical protein
VADGVPEPPPPPEGGTLHSDTLKDLLKNNCELNTLMPELPDTTLKSTDAKVPPSGGGGGIQVLVFKTNLANNRHIKKIESSLNLHPHIQEWNVDLHDCDKILRIVTEKIHPSEIEKIVFNAGYSCKELK